MSEQQNGEETKTNNDTVTVDDENEADYDPQFDPLIILPEIDIKTNEENEEELIKLRAKLFRFDTTVPDTPEWKKSGTGEVKLLRHKENNSVRIVMRRDKTLKICANHFITPWMEVKPSCGSNRAWVWTVRADFADEIAKIECLAIRFVTPDIANQWKNKFEEAKQILKEKCELYNTTNISLDEEEKDEKSADDQKEKDTNDDEKVISKMTELNVSKD